jgi:hypothetical protein
MAPNLSISFKRGSWLMVRAREPFTHTGAQPGSAAPGPATGGVAERPGGLLGWGEGGESGIGISEGSGAFSSAVPPVLDSVRPGAGAGAGAGVGTRGGVAVGTGAICADACRPSTGAGPDGCTMGTGTRGGGRG